MSLFWKPLEEVSNADLLALIDDEVIESKHIEYKQQLPGNQREDKIAFLAGVSSFSNTDGGDFVIGVKAENGIPKELRAIPARDVDGAITRLSQMLESGLAPRIAFDVKPILVDSQGALIIVRAAQSWAGPHRIIFGGHDKFYARGSGKKVEMDVNELRAAFLRSANVADRLEEARSTALSRLDNTRPIREARPTWGLAEPWLLMQCVPLISLFDPIQIRLSDALQKFLLIGPLECETGEYRINIDGIYSEKRYQREDESSYLYAYFQLYRNGTIESALHIGEMDQPRKLSTHFIEVELLKAYRRFLRLQAHTAVRPPIAILVTLFGVRGYTLLLDSRLHRVFSQPIDRDLISLPPVLVGGFTTDRATVLRPLFDALWNAAGLLECQDYDESGALLIDPINFRDESANPHLA